MKIRSIAASMSLLFFLDSFCTTGAQDALAPGPMLDKRTQILQYLNKAKTAGIGVKPYADALDKIEVQVKDGKTEAEIKPQVDRLIAALAQQVSNLKALKATAASRAAVPLPEAAPVASGPAPTSFTFEALKSAAGGGNRPSTALVGLNPEYTRLSRVRGRAVPEATLERLLFDLANKHRRENHLSPYSYNSRLAGLAKGHAQDMVQNNFFSHVNKEHKGPLERAQSAGYTTITVWENIAAVGPGRGTPIGMVMTADEGLMNSPGHRAAILNVKGECGGVGVCYDTVNGGIKLCQVFSPNNF
jgi:uncharacterized protein YkwD